MPSRRFRETKDLTQARGIYDSIGTQWKPPAESMWKADALMSQLEPSDERLRGVAAGHLEDLRRLWPDAAFRTYMSRRDVQEQISIARLTYRR